jgi:hypothetical protein
MFICLNNICVVVEDMLFGTLVFASCVMDYIFSLLNAGKNHLLL